MDTTGPFPHGASCATFPKYVCASERVKLIGTINARFPDFGHHQEKEMGGLWLHPIKLLDGFWLRLWDRSAENVDLWLIADGYEVFPWGNTFHFGSNLGHTAVRVTQRQLCPDEAAGLIVEYDFHNQGHHSCSLEVEWLARTDLQPVWYSETAGLTGSKPETAEWLPAEGAFSVRCPDREWSAAVGCRPAPVRWETHQRFGPEITAGRGLGLSLYHALTLNPGECTTLRFLVAGSFVSPDDCLAQYRCLDSGQDFMAAKKNRYAALLDRSRVRVPDPGFNDTYNWIKVHTDWLTMDAGPYGRGLAAGFPEYPWWFGCDNCYALQGVLAMGDFRLARDTLLLLLNYSEKHNGNGRILHEVTTAGLCANPGNTQETAHFIVMLWLYYEWTGDKSLLERAFDTVRKSVAWLREQDPDDECFPGGYGIIEIAGLNSRMLDTAVYTAEAWRCYARICRLLGRGDEAGRYEALAVRAAAAINTHMWDEDEGLYCDAYTSVEEVVARRSAILQKSHSRNAARAEETLDALIAQKRKAGNGKSGWLLNRSWIINTPMEMGLAPADKARRALQKLHTPDYVGPYGMYLSGLYRDAAMTISTGVMAAAQARYGYADRALELLQRMFAAMGKAAPGCLAEMSPDYGCFIQGWTVYAAMVPVVRYFFGVQPQADPDGGHTLVLRPAMPAAWEDAELEKAPVLDGVLSLAFSRQGADTVYRGRFNGRAAVMFALPPAQAASVNGQRYPAADAELLVPLADENRAGRFEITLFSK